MNIFSKVSSDNTVSKSFKYSKGKVQLNFVLRTDIKSELKDFLELLKTATKEVELEINNKK